MQDSAFNDTIFNGALGSGVRIRIEEKNNMLIYYIEGYFCYFAMVISMQYFTILLLAVRENMNCIGKEKRNKLLWLLPKEMCYVTFLTKAILVVIEAFFDAGIVMMVVGELPATFFLMVLSIGFFYAFYVAAKVALLNKKTKGKPWKSIMGGQECGTKPIKVRMYGSGFKRFIYGIIIKVCLICVMNVVYLLQDPKPFRPFIKFLEWLLITGFEAYVVIHLWMEEKGLRRVITVEGGQAVYKDGRGRCRQFLVSDLYWMDTPYGVIKVFDKKEDLIVAYVTSACGVKEFCSIVEEVEWTEPED